MKKYFIFALILILTLLINSASFAVQPAGKEYHTGKLQEIKAPEKAEFSGKLEAGIRVIEIKASRYKFEPDPIVVKLGERVRLSVSSTDITHGLEIPEFQVRVTAPVGKNKSIEFIASKKGTFHVRCSVYCGAGHSLMHATFIVK